MRVVLLLIAMFCISQQSMAQTSSTFEVPVFKKIVEVSASNVNLRKRPDVKSAKVGVVTNGQVLVVVGETDEWYKIFTSEWIAPYDGGRAEREETRVGYVMKKFCRDVTTRNIKKDDWEVYVRPNGRHKGVCMYASYNIHDVDWCGLTFAIGKQIDNIMVLPYRIWVDEGEKTNRRVEIKKGDGNYYKMAFKDGMIIDAPYHYVGSDIAFSKLTDADIDYIINNMSKMSKESGRLLFYTGERQKDEDFICRTINYGRGSNLLQFQKYSWTSNLTAQ